MDMTFILYSIGVFLTIVLILVVILLVAKKYLSPSGQVTVTINGKEKLTVDQGASLLSTLAGQNVYLPSACGGKGSCGQCKCQIVEGGGEILDSEKGHFTRKQIKEGYRLGCQAKVKGDLSIKVPDSVMGVKEWECTVIGNKNVATFIKEYKVALPPGEHMDFEPGSYAQIKIPAFDCIDYDKDFDKSLIGDTYLPAWEKFGLFPLKCVNPEPTIRAYSMANYPDEGDIITLNAPADPEPEHDHQVPDFFTDYNLNPQKVKRDSHGNVILDKDLRPTHLTNANGEPIEADWTGTIETGSVQLTEVNGDVAAEGTEEKIAEVMAGLEDGSIHVFDTAAFTVGGETLDSYEADVDTDADYTPDTEVISDGYFHESEFRSAPYFDLKIDGITLADEAY